jgi:pSer/pThr/pTyr-binding forkhead associated (FHA) protein
MASLYVVRGRDQGKQFQLTAPVSRIGRDASSSVQLFDTEASRSHAEIRFASDDQFELVDLGSSNGTKVNGQLVSRHQLTTGDRIEIGQTLLIFTGVSQPAEVAAAHRVDIVRQNYDDDGSRIVSSLSQLLPKADDLSSAIESASRDSETDRSLEVMYLTAIAVGRTDDLDQLLNRILRLVFDWVDYVLLRGVTGMIVPLGKADECRLAPRFWTTC